MKTLKFACFLISFFLGFKLIISNLNAEENRFFVDKVIAVVNRDVITWSELYRYMEFTIKDKIKGLTPEEKFKYFKAHEEEFLERLIDTKLQIEEAEKYGIFVSDIEIEQAIDDIKKKYSLTEQEFLETLKKEGMSLNEYKRMLKDEITIGRAVNSLVKSKIIITDAEINHYIKAHPELSCDEEGYYISQIFLKKRDNQEELRAKINQIFEKLLQGEPFSKVASEISEDITAKTGGMLGLLKKKEIAPELSILFSKMNVGQVSEPMISESGIFIFRLDGICFKRGSEQLVNYVKNLLEDEKFKKDYKLWIRSLRQRAYIEIMN